MNLVQRILVEKKQGFNIEAKGIKKDLISTLGIENIENIRVVNVYDIENVNESKLDDIVNIVLSEPNVDTVNYDEIKFESCERVFRIELLPGQYDQRADSAAQCIEIITLEERPFISASRIIVVKGDISDIEFEKIKKYMINPVEAREAGLEIPETVKLVHEVPADVEILEGFTAYSFEEIVNMKKEMGLAMTDADLDHIKVYFRDEEKRNPTITEIKVIDTYWSDHCRHTTFMTELKDIKINENKYTVPVQKAYDEYLTDREYVYTDRVKVKSLMDLATINMKTLRKQGKLDDMDVSEEINACSVDINVDVDGKDEEWLLMFKNETHNHPTEIEPFGGAATCLGGAIRDPLSGRSYVYQSMRVTGAANPLGKIEDTIEGKLPQKVITQKASSGFSSYGNQIGLATGVVTEVYDDGFLAKRMEVGAVVGATPKANVVRECPEEGDIIVLVGGRTGRDGIGGATGSSKEHDEDSLETCGAEVQKGNAPAERKLQRLFRIAEVAKIIKRCNDFGAGGVSVAIGELADSLEINLDEIQKKYEGLDGTEIAISESQERMAVVIEPQYLEMFMEHSAKENLEAKVVGKVTDSGRLIMTWRGKEILNVSRAFLDTNGVKGEMNIQVSTPSETSVFEDERSKYKELDDNKVKTQWLNTLGDLNICSQKGLVEKFDSTIGSNTVLMPYGGKFYNTPVQTMVAKIPLLEGETNTGSAMSYGYDPSIGKWSPFHGGMYSVVDSIAKVVSTGGDYKTTRLSLQEYFERLGDDSSKWGNPFSALLGASYAQRKFETAAIGGKDSMSGTFKDISVPPTLISFAITAVDVRDVISPELKNTNSDIYIFNAVKDDAEVIDFEKLLVGYDKINKLILEKKIISAYAVGRGGIVTALSKMAFGNKIGFTLSEELDSLQLFASEYGSIVFEVTSDFDQENEMFKKIGKTNGESTFEYKTIKIDIETATKTWEDTLKPVFPEIYSDQETLDKTPRNIEFTERSKVSPKNKTNKPTVFIPAFPGTNCEMDTKRAFEKAGANVELMIFKNLTAKDVNESIDQMVSLINKSQIIALPGGFSAGDEPEGSGKFIASAFRNPKVSKAVMEMLNERDGLMLGICNGFQALVKLGLLPYGEIRNLDENSPTLTFNHIGRHVSKMARVKVSSVNSPWMKNSNTGDVYQTAFSHGEGRFYAGKEVVDELVENGQVATQYVDFGDKPSYDGNFNINGSVEAIEGIFSADGRIFGKMGHVERTGDNVYKNIIGPKDFEIFKAGVDYFK